MKKLLAPFIAILFLASCGMGSMTDMQPDLENSTELLANNSDNNLLNARMQISQVGNCEADCIEPGSEIYYPVSDMASLTAGKNSKSVSYEAYNTETDFVVEATYAVTAGNSNAEANITITIDGDEVEYTDVNSGTTVTHTVPLTDEWARCDQVAFSVVQEGLGTPITINEIYSLIPVCAEEGLKIGATYEGGIIAYILQDGDPGYVENEIHGIIAAPIDQSTGSSWDEGLSQPLTGATGTALGTGQANTTAIVNTYGAGIYAAKLCNDLELGDYTDWYLPSKDELNLMYQNIGPGDALGLGNVGGFNIEGTLSTTSLYWSSSEFNESFAWLQDFADGSQGIDDKLGSGMIRVRAVRTF